MNKFFIMFLAAAVLIITAKEDVMSQKVKEVLGKVKIIAVPENGKPVDYTVAEELRKIIPGAEIKKYAPGSVPAGRGVFRIAVSAEKFARGPGEIRDGKDWLYFRIVSTGVGELVTSGQHLLYSLFCEMKDNWLDTDAGEFENGKLIRPGFNWITGNDGYYSSRRRYTRNYDHSAAIKEIARMGCSHVFVNALSQPFSLETGPPGEIYYRFYVDAPDLDQFTETELNKGTYPPEYINANMTMMKKLASMAVKYGLTPGMHICNPRSVPESLLQKYPYLRGARIDHPFRSFRPRYTLTLGHPVVRWHYAEMLRNILREIPEMGFVLTFLNDSGSGFEHTMRLYPGRNGGPYIVREWRTNKEFAEAAAGNVIRYYRMLRDVASELNPEFRIIAGLRAIPEEEEIIVKGMDNRLDRAISLADSKNPDKWPAMKAMLDRGSYLHSGISLKHRFVPGIPFPWLAEERLSENIKAGLNRVSVHVSPFPLSPYDINRSVLQAFQVNGSVDVEKLAVRQAEKWAGKKYSGKLIEIWKMVDGIYRDFPNYPLYGDFAFEWNRLWVRPYVPDIEKIPEKDRAYYEKYLISIFNNPHNVDLNADCLWDLYGVEKSDKLVKDTDEKIWGPLDDVISRAEKTAAGIPDKDPAKKVFVNLRDKLRAYKAYNRTLRNTAAWIAGVHGYLRAKDKEEKQKRLNMVREMMDNEIDNIKSLIELIETTKVDIFPVFEPGETWFEYGDNIGELLKKKIALMEKHINDMPYIDPNYMWRMPEGFPVDKEEYLKY